MDEKNCIVCGAEAPKRCSICRSVHYCSIEHQKLHWKEHKLSCSLPYRVDWDVDIGHNLVANKDLEPGDLILAEDPLVIVPMIIDEPLFGCVGCNQILKQTEIVNCPQCKWPMCGKQQCWVDGSLHALGECTLLKVAGHSRWAPKDVVYRSVWILRCLSLKEKEPAKWEKLVKITKSLGSTLIGDDFKDVVKFVNRWLPDTAFPKELMKKICSLFQINSIDLFTRNQTASCGLYSLVSKMQQCCVPNATYGFKESGQIVVRAAVPITKGSRIYNDYTINGLRFTMKRQSILKKTRFGSCACQRCKDPTELGTFAGGIYCPRCPHQEGVLLPENPLNQTADWLCNKCFIRHPIKLVVSLMKDSVEDLWSLNRLSAPDCEKFIQKHAKTLHPHNFLLTDIKLDLINNYRPTLGKNMNDADYKLLEKKEALILELLKIADVVSPGLSNIRRHLLRDYFENIADHRRNAGLNDGNAVENAVESYRTELKFIYEKFSLDGFMHYRVK